jgi:hypothetical protein
MQFQRDIEGIALRFGVKSDLLAEIVRRSDALAAMRHKVDNGRGLLMAARDRPEERPGTDQTLGE